jgi:hypothetical protein
MGLKRRAITRIVLLFGVVALLVFAGYTYFSSREQAPDELYGPSFQYYPKANVYYDVEKDRYYSIVNEKWQPNPSLAEEGSTYLGKHVLIDSPAVPVWKDNEYHRLVFGTALYNSPGEFDKKYTEDSLRSMPRKEVIRTDTLAAETGAKKKKGVRAFFDKLFKKRDKKD